MSSDGTILPVESFSDHSPRDRGDCLCPGLYSQRKPTVRAPRTRMRRPATASRQAGHLARQSPEAGPCTGNRLNWEHSIEAARLLAGSSASSSALGRPIQAMMRRALSTAYYAMFHALCQSNADTLVGSSPAGPNIALWLDTCRTLEHRGAKNRLASYVTERQKLAIRDFAQTFGSMKEQRISADYDPIARFVRSQVMAVIDRAEDATRAFVSVPAQTRRTLVVYLLVRRRS